MLKRIVSAIVCVLLLAYLPSPALAAWDLPVAGQRNLSISTPEQLMVFAENCRLDSYSRDLFVTLKEDIDMSGIPFEGIPVFYGSFEGNGHTVSGLDISCEGSFLGLFRYLQNGASVSNLFVEGSIHPQGSRQAIGGIAGSNAGTIENCGFTGTLSGSDHVGAIAGTNRVTGVIDGCRAAGNVSGNHFVGGIAGSNAGVIRECENAAAVNTTAMQNTLELSDITLESMTDTEAVNTVTDIGGIAGSNNGVIRSCGNLGNVGYRSMGYNIGGIAGSQMGYITQCRNSGTVNGRKEVGGIAGQMEPVAKIEYTQDTLQILKGQLNTVSSLANRASSHAQEGASDVSWHISGIQDSIYQAEDAVGIMLEEGLDPDSILAAENVLSNSLQSIESNLSGAAGALYDTAGTLSSDMRAISNQVSAMQDTINHASENLGGTVTDISDLDTEADLAGKVSLCENSGSVSADTNAGGITGAIAPENDLDFSEDLLISGEESLNFSSELRSVVLECANTASVSASKQNAGGIAGWMPMGLVKNCVNTGDIQADEANYVGGVAGQSTGFIRACHAKCDLTGREYVGGIAGSAQTVTDCRSIVRIHGSERTGAVIGYREISTGETDSQAEERPPVHSNFYAPIGPDPGAVDGISYDTLAQPLSMEDFLTLEGLPQQMTRFTVSFVFAQGTVKTVSVAPGATLQEADIPNLAIVDGRASRWDGDITAPIAFDCTFHALYDPLVPVLESDLTDGGRPTMLAEGAFLPGAVLQAEHRPWTNPLPAGEKMRSCIAVTLPVSEEPVKLRLRLPEEADSAQLKLYAAEGSALTPVSFETDGSYLVFPAGAGEYILTQAAGTSSFPILAVTAAAAGCAALFLILRRKKKASSR